VSDAASVVNSCSACIKWASWPDSILNWCGIVVPNGVLTGSYNQLALSRRSYSLILVQPFHPWFGLDVRSPTRVYFSWGYVYHCLHRRRRVAAQVQLLELALLRHCLRMTDYRFRCLKVLMACRRELYCSIRIYKLRGVTVPETVSTTMPRQGLQSVRKGGGSKHNRKLKGEQLVDHIFKPISADIEESREYVYTCYIDAQNLDQVLKEDPRLVAVQLPLETLSNCLSIEEMRFIGQVHGITLLNRGKRSERLDRFRNHHCPQCNVHFSLFVPAITASERKENERLRSLKRREEATKPSNEKIKLKRTDGPPKVTNKKAGLTLYETAEKSIPIDEPLFPPDPPTQAKVERIVRNFCAGTSPEAFQETGCAVCGRLVLLTDIHSIESVKDNLQCLIAAGVTSVERQCVGDENTELEGPVLDSKCKGVCTSCKGDLSKGKRPLFALANGLWLGEVPTQLKNLTFAEQMMVARIRHNRCLVRVSSGRAKMIANCIMFSTPTVEVYNVLPPSSTELNEVLAFVFLGSAKPTPDEFKRTPMLVRRKNVLAALEWLKVNHTDYADLQISKENLATYPEEGPPVVVDYRPMLPEDSNRIATAMSKHDGDEELGTEDGPCPFTVQGMTGEEYAKMSMKALKIKAMQHLEQGGRLLGIGHSEEPQSMYDNPQIYPQMFPWLFPYGLGGIGQSIHKKKLSHASHKRWLLMFHDKRFQTDLYFPIVAFNHEQMRSSSTGSFLLAKRKNFDAVANRMLTLNPAVLEDLADRMKKGCNVVPETDQEKACFKVLEDVDHVNGNVQGSLTSKKYMRNEIWSFVSFKGAPSWFITFSPADSRHPLCLYYADRQEKFSPELRSAKERDLLVLANPVAAARFFHHMVNMFIKHILNYGEDTDGLYGKTGGYYGTVEQQGRLTLHMHMMIWIEGVLSPQDIRDKIMDSDSAFQESLVAYLEGCHIGEFMTGTMEEHKQKIDHKQELGAGIHSILQTESNDARDPDYKDPTQTLPESPPLECAVHLDAPIQDCPDCVLLSVWRQKYVDMVDDLLLRSNVHTCRAGREQKKMGKGNKNNVKGQLTAKEDSTQKTHPKGCLNKDGVCTARFPRTVYPETVVAEEDGHIFLKKREAMMNTFTPALTYVMRCNTDVSSLLSGTSLKAIISYVTDYITKPSLKTYQIFSSAYDVYEKNSELIGGDIKAKEAAHKLIVKIVNSLGSKMEIGSPAACMYLLGNPDHYKSHMFVPFWWKSFVSDVYEACHPGNADPLGVSIDSENTPPAAHDGEATQGANPNMKNDTVSKDRSQDVDVRIPENLQRSDNHREGGGPDQCKDTPVYDARTTVSSDFTPPNGDVTSVTEIPGDQPECEPPDEKVVIGKEGGEYIQRSYVDDYKYRPRIYSDMSLYNWIQCYSKRRRSKKNIDRLEAKLADIECGESDGGVSESGGMKRYQPFTKEHPLYLRYEAHCDFKKLGNVVPNFVGGTLPRADQGDREYYCMTMLTLFKPWRNGLDLKKATENWDSAFIDHNFKSTEISLIKNFGLKYECLDARDDFHSELKKKSREAHNGDRYMPADSDSSEDEDAEEHAEKNHAQGSDNFHILGHDTLKIRTKMAEVMNIMKGCGWFKKCSGVINTVVSRILPTSATASQWKQAVKEARDAALKRKRRDIPNNDHGKGNTTTGAKFFEGVKVVDADYLHKDFKVKQQEDRDIIDAIVVEFSLNKEQERAFRIIANHAASSTTEQLKMYLGGMGGTGKSQVIKAVTTMFERKKESHRFIVLAPTGSAAALLNGFTYHSALGVHIKQKGDSSFSGNGQASVADARERLTGVEYVFIDEISMIACHELFAISSRLAGIFNVHDMPFGGVNIILAGDFAQLPPTKGSPLYSNTVAKSQNSRMSVFEQESFIGQLMWHQVTTVVILKQNMRQKSQSEEDSKLRTALENMRYAACTPEDIAFLRTRVVGSSPSAPSFTDPELRHVSIITSWNAQKDKINELGCERYASDTGQTLTSFYSFDRPVGGDGISKSKGVTAILTPKRKEALWSSPPCTSDHIPGCLKLCIGMPIMIRHNDATELCITKGQEGHVVGWDSHEGSDGKLFLDTLFVQLDKPPKDIKIDGLPLNVVPIPKSSTTVTCLLPNDKKIVVHRQQVVVLPNFSMTDYASQGKTRPVNPVDLSHCTRFQSFYTCLSRSASASGTVIVQGFDPKSITKGISGFLRQEFRELEMLNIITELNYNRLLPNEVNGTLRNPLIRSFQLWKKNQGIGHIDQSWHRAIKWGSLDASIKEPEVNAMWNTSLKFRYSRLPVEPSKGKNKTKIRSYDTYITEAGASQEKLATEVAKKKRRTDADATDVGPTGLIWDSVNYSCAYDALFTVLYNLWKTDTLLWTEKLYYTPHMKNLCERFGGVLDGRITFETARDEIRAELRSISATRFPTGSDNTIIDHIVSELTGDANFGSVVYKCSQCPYISPPRRLLTVSTAVSSGMTDAVTLSAALELTRKRPTNRPCQTCAEGGVEVTLDLVSINIDVPYLFIVSIDSVHLVPSLVLDIPHNDEVAKMQLCGIIYGDGHHFVCRIIDESGTVWYHDGIATRSQCRREQTLTLLSDCTWLKKSGEKIMVYCIYKRIT